MPEYCLEMIPRIESLAVEASGEEREILAEMCCYAGEL